MTRIDEYVAAKQRIFENQTASILPSSISMIHAWPPCRHRCAPSGWDLRRRRRSVAASMEEPISTAIGS